MNDAIPLMISVTGHREIAESQKSVVRQAVQDLLRSLRMKYPNTPLVILSPLAAGVDAWVAEAALELPDVPVELCAVLPWPKDVEDQIASGDGSRWGAGLISRATQKLQLPLPMDVTVDELRNEPNKREARFDAVGRYIARHGQILLAVWNGCSSDGSHSAKVIEYHSKGAASPLGPQVTPLDRPELSAVYHIPIARASDATAPYPSTPRWNWPQVDVVPDLRKPAQGWVNVLKSSICKFFVRIHEIRHWLTNWKQRHENEGEHLLRQRWQAIDRYNRDVAKLINLPSFSKKLEQSRSWLIPEADVPGLPEEVRHLRQAFSVADVMALHWQSRYRRFVLVLFGIALWAIITLEIYAHRISEWPVLAIYIILLSCGYVVFRWTKLIGHQGRWLDARTLAEALRVQVYWRWAGKLNCVADHYLRHFRGELDWVRHAARAAYLMSGAHNEFPVRTLVDEKKDIERVLECWVVDQRKFFARSTPANAELEVTFETASRLAFGVAVGSALFQLWFHRFHNHMSHELVLVTFGSLVATAFLEEFSDIQAYALLARRYDWMASLFQTAEHRLQPLISSPHFDRSTAHSALNLIFELGREALAENSDWVVQHRQRPPVLPSG